MKTKILLISVILIISLGSLFFIGYLILKSKGNDLASEKEINFTIPGVPYVGIFNHKGEMASISRESEAAVFSILEYWNPGKTDIGEIHKFLEPIKTKTENEISDVINHVYPNQYSAKIMTLNYLEIKQYINSEVRTPLITSLKISENQPSQIGYYPWVIIIGVNELEKKIILHDFWRGNNYEMSYNEFEKLGNINNTTKKKKFIIIQPSNFSEAVANIKSKNLSIYPARTSIMNETKKIVANYAVGRAAISKELNQEGYLYFLKVIEDGNFEKYCPPFIKMRTYTYLSDILRETKSYEAARINADKAIAINYDLDKSFKDWPGYDLVENGPNYLGQSCAPYRALGDILRETERYSEAKEAYFKALEICPSLKVAKEGLLLVEKM